MVKWVRLVIFNSLVVRIDNDAALAHIQQLSGLLASLDEEDALIDRAVELHLFAFMRKTIVQSERFAKEVSSHTTTHTAHIPVVYTQKQTVHSRI